MNEKLYNKMMIYNKSRQIAITVGTASTWGGKKLSFNSNGCEHFSAGTRDRSIHFKIPPRKFSLFIMEIPYKPLCNGKQTQAFPFSHHFVESRSMIRRLGAVRS
ncbi:hypothetical protein Salat_1100900 [Sesamum alatum]|uniref:Uncharacterized protein n=1 Tax=Sesamum alatum TaxID=300844 RepID=A0AAE2CSX5_9LAMI|nr:hypothetical protein Salat_1100900 [Sesamum alatum]